MKKLYQKLSVALLIAMTTPVAVAQLNNFNVNASGGQTAGQIAQNINSSLAGGLDLVEGLSYVAAFVFGLMGVFKLKAYDTDPRNTPLKTPMILFLLAAISIALPTLIGSGVKTVWNSGTVQTSTAPLQRY